MGHISIFPLSPSLTLHSIFLSLSRLPYISVSYLSPSTKFVVVGREKQVGCLCAIDEQKK